MATFKHISSKNADYGAAEAYLTFEHDEFTMKPTLDENGRLIPREDYRISSLNCGGEDFAVACMRANLRYEKNQKREDVKSHHYIISFDPRDGTDNGLTVDRAQELGEQFCKEHFPGHQALVCTHPDGHNHSGNTAMSYTLSPEPDDDISVCDCAEGDRPLEIAPCADSYAPEAQNDIACVGVIGGAVGPAAVVFGKNAQGRLHAVCSALHFEPVAEDIEWRVDFHVVQFSNKTFLLI